MSDRINLEKGKVGANILGGYEKVSAIVGAFGVLEGEAGKIEIGVPIQFRNPIEADAFGVQSNPLLRHHVREYFRMGGVGASLWILNTAIHTTYTELIQDETVRLLIARAGGEIFNLGFHYIPTSTTYVDGLNAEILPAIKEAQLFADWCRETNRPLHIVLSGSGYKGVASEALNLRDLKNGTTQIECPQVSLCIAQDYDFAETLTGAEQKYSAVGTVLGCMASQPVSFNIGEVQTMSLTDATRNLWLTAGLCSHEKVTDVESQLNTLNTKGYVFGEYYSGQVVFNDDHVCTPVIVDAEGNMNEHSMAISRTNAKVFRELFKAYEPKLKSTPPVNPTTGFLGLGMLKYYESIGNDIFDNMTKAFEMSGGDTVVDPKSNLLFGEKALNVSYNWVPMGVVSRINGIVNIRRSLV